MATIQLRLRLLLGIGLVLAGVACSDSSASLAPTGPSGRGGSSTGAVITGRVSGIGLAPSSTDTFAPQTTTAVRVTIAGTNISTMVDGAGQFTLNGVPPGTVTLTFTGSGISASITLTGVTADQEIRLEIRLNGNNARVEAENRGRRDDDDDDDEFEDEANEVEGVVSERNNAACPAITFKVGTRTVMTTAATVFADPCAAIVNGVRVEAKGSRGANGVFNAVRVEID